MSTDANDTEYTTDPERAEPAVEPTDAEPGGQADPQSPESGQTESTEQAGNEVTEDDDADTGNSEAAKWRRKLRDAETERDGLRDQLAEVRKQMAEAQTGLSKPEALWVAGTDVDSLYTEDGRLDTDALEDAVKTAADALGLSRGPRAPRPNAAQAVTDEPTGPSWSSALEGRH